MLLLEFIWTRSKSKVEKDVPKFRELDVPKRKTLIKFISLGSISTLVTSYKLVPFNLPSKFVSPKMANPAPNIYLAWDKGNHSLSYFT